MGNISSYDYCEGGDIDTKKLVRLIKERKIEDYTEKEIADISTVEELGEYINDWKIQGYWYKSFCAFLQCVAESIINIDDDPDNNYIAMTEEQGQRFFIRFIKPKDCIPKIIVDIQTMDFSRHVIMPNGEIKDTGKTV